MYKHVARFLCLTLIMALIVSCQKEIDGTIVSGGGGGTTLNQKPKVGTTWTYRYYIYHPDGSLYQSSVLTYKAKSLDTLGGETWLRVVDADADTTVYYLQSRADGLYQYTNNSSNLFCKDPAVPGDSYNTFNEGVAENFIVMAVKDTLPTGIGDVPVNYYEGFRSSTLIDLVWYNEYAWIVRKSQYRNRSRLVPDWYKYSTHFLDRIVY